MTDQDRDADRLALADEIEASNGLIKMLPGPNFGTEQLGIRRTAMIASALRATRRDEPAGTAGTMPGEAGEKWADPQFVSAWVLNEVLCEIIERGVTESREIASHVVAHPKIKAGFAPSRPAAQPMREALERCEGYFELIRKKLVNNLDEPERSAFWAAVEARDMVRAAILALAPASANEVKHD